MAAPDSQVEGGTLLSPGPGAVGPPAEWKSHGLFCRQAQPLGPVPGPPASWRPSVGEQCLKLLTRGKDPPASESLGHLKGCSFSGPDPDSGLVQGPAFQVGPQ